MKKRILSFLLVLVLIGSVILTAYAASSATIIRAVDNNPNLGKKTFDITITFKTSTAANKNIAASACDNSSFVIRFPATVDVPSVSKHGASDSWSGRQHDGSYYYFVKLGKNFMTTNGDTLTITFNGIDALPYEAQLTLASTTVSRSYKGSLTITVNGSNFWSTTLGGSTGNQYSYSCSDTYPAPTSSSINLSTKSVTAPLNSTSNITYTVYSQTPRGSDLADGYLLKTSEGIEWKCKGYVISERLVQANNTNAFSASGISLDSKNKKIAINGATINAAQQTYKFRIESTLVSGILTDSTVKYLGGQVKVYSPVITVNPQPASVTFRYHPNGGSQPDNFVTWVAKPNSGFPDSHWNYANSNDTYYMTRHGYTATGYYAKADGSCAYHQDDSFTSYADLCSKYGVSTTGEHTIDIYAQWSPNNYTVSFNANGGSAVDSITAPYESTVTLPTPTKAGHRFNGWQGNLKDIATLTNGMEINDTSKGTIGPNAGYAVTEYLVPVVGGATYTSNYEVCGLYSYDANGKFIKRESSYATTHTLSSNAAFVRVEVNVAKGISFEEYQNNLTLTYTLPAGTSIPVGGNQTLTAQWTTATYTVTWKNYDGSVLETDTDIAYNSTPTYNGATPMRAEDENFTYTFKGWSPTVSAVTEDVVYTAEFTATSKRVEPSYIITIPATANVGESITVIASDVVLNTDETLTVTLHSDFKLISEENAELTFMINNGAITNNAVVLSVSGNGDKNNPLKKESEPLAIKIAEEAKYAGNYTGNIIFTIAVSSAENS